MVIEQVIPLTSADDNTLECAVGSHNGQSRAAILGEMQKLGVNVQAFESLTIDQLSDLLYGMNKLANLRKKSGNGKKDSVATQQLLSLSLIDKQILKRIIQSEANTTMIAISRELGIPLTTVQRRFKRMQNLVSRRYTLNFAEFGMKLITFLVTSEGQEASQIGVKVLAFIGVRKAVRTIGSGIDWKIDAVLRTNNAVTELGDKIRTVAGVKSVMWLESLETATNSQKYDNEKDLSLSLIENM